MMGRIGKKKDDHDNSERWLLTYADLITLLLGLFVILYAMSKIDAGKYTRMIAALGGVFGNETNVAVHGGTGVLEPPINALAKEREKIEQQVKAALPVNTQLGRISLSQNERGITVHIMEELLFASGSADLKEGALGVLDSLSGVLAQLPNDIRVEGHTDNIPIHSPAFPSNWHLSVARAVNTGFYMIEHHGLSPSKVSVVGYAEYRPLVPNVTESDRAHNRRVDIVIVTNVGHDRHAGEGQEESVSQHGAQQ